MDTTEWRRRGRTGAKPFLDSRALCSRHACIRDARQDSNLHRKYFVTWVKWCQQSTACHLAQPEVNSNGVWADCNLECSGNVTSSRYRERRHRRWTAMAQGGERGSAAGSWCDVINSLHFPDVIMNTWRVSLMSSICDVIMISCVSEHTPFLYLPCLLVWYHRRWSYDRITSGQSSQSPCTITNLDCSHTFLLTFLTFPIFK